MERDDRQGEEFDGAEVRDLRETFGLVFAPRASRVARPELA